MSATIISGKDLAKSLRKEMKMEVDRMNEQNRRPKLVVILVGDDPASHSYVRGKKKACQETGIESVVKELPDTISEQKLLGWIDQFNKDKSVHGILVQLPLPNHIDETKVIETISPEKDVDGFHPMNVGKMMTGQETFLPCTPYGIIEMLKASGRSIAGKHVVVVGRSNIVGKPVGQLLLNKHATVTYCHSKTVDLHDFTKLADILIVAVGKAEVIGKEAVKEGAVVIDVGVNRVDGKLVGDVKFEEVKEIASYITPVPGGVGPMTITMLLRNTIEACKRLSQ